MVRGSASTRPGRQDIGRLYGATDEDGRHSEVIAALWVLRGEEVHGLRSSAVAEIELARSLA